MEFSDCCSNSTRIKTSMASQTSKRVLPFDVRSQTTEENNEGENYSKNKYYKLALQVYEVLQDIEDMDPNVLGSPGKKFHVDPKINQNEENIGNAEMILNGENTDEVHSLAIDPEINQNTEESREIVPKISENKENISAISYHPESEPVAQTCLVDMSSDVPDSQGKNLDIDPKTRHTIESTAGEESNALVGLDDHEIMFKSFPFGYRPPPEFTSLSSLHPNHKLVNVLGVVTHFEPVSQSRGTDLVMKIYIKDPSHYESSIEIIFFRREKYDFPDIYGIGDIVLFNRIKAGQYNGALQLVSNKATTFLVCSGTSSEPVSLDNARRHRSYTSSMLSKEAIKNVSKLRYWLELNKDVIKPTLITTLSEIQNNSYCHVIGNLVSAETYMNPQQPSTTLLLKIYDGTTPPSHISDPMENTQSSKPGVTSSESPRVLWDRTDEFAKEKLIDIYIGEKHAQLLYHLSMNVNTIILFHSAFVDVDISGCLKLTLNNEGPDPCGVTFINPSSAIAKQVKQHTL